MVLMLDSLVKEKISYDRVRANIIELRISAFKPKVQFRLNCGDYTIQTAISRSDILKVIELRNHSFVNDFAETLQAHYVEFDEHDMHADHIMVVNNNTGLLLGSYRIICSQYTSLFYSPEQFQMSKLLATADIKSELGRACVHKDHRNGIILNLIWRGIAEYVKQTETRFVFGCTSIKNIDPNIAYSIYWHLKSAGFVDEECADVLPKYKFPYDNCENFKLLPWSEVAAFIPVLLTSYLKAGAKLCSEPALDTIYGCTDILTVLDIQKMDTKYHYRYFVKGHHE